MPIEMKNPYWQIAFRPDGTIQSASVREGDDTVQVKFGEGEWGGPRFYGEWDGAAHLPELTHDSNTRFTGTDGDLRFTLEYAADGPALSMRCTVENIGYTPVQPQVCGLRLGVDTYMKSYPDWNEQYFPTLLRCEKTHFYGYLMRPDGRILGGASPDPVASWNNAYNIGYGDNNCEWGGHRIHTVNLDLLHAHPLPERHPQHLYQIVPGQSITWTVLLQPVPALEDVMPVLSALCDAPLLDIDNTTVGVNEIATIEFYAPRPVELSIISPHGIEQPLPLPEDYDGISIAFDNSDDAGVYRLIAFDESGKETEAMVSLRREWSWYLQQARVNALTYRQKAATHNETWYGLFSMFLAQKHFPDEETHAQVEARWNLLYPLMYDTVTHLPTKEKWRTQNIASMAGVLADRYAISGDETDMVKAATLVDWIIENRQKPDGAIVSGKNHWTDEVWYTTVIYPVKNMMEVWLIERTLPGDEWQARADRHYTAIKAALDDIIRRDGDLDTEGQLTFEDGMISCAALQLAMFAVLQTDESERQHYTQAAQKYIDSHRCLEQLVIPDSRQRGGTLRFWEAQYDIHMIPNMMNSPHGWTSWATYALWYLYLLTGDADYLRQAMNALGSSVQVIDAATGDLRWAFVPDPYVEVKQISAPIEGLDADLYNGGVYDPVETNPRHNGGHYHPNEHTSREFVIGEQYLRMVADWSPANGSDNDVHEHFKCLEEIALTSAYVVENEDGDFEAWNCTAEQDGDTLVITSTEAVVKAVHLNFAGTWAVRVAFAGGETVSASVKPGTHWLGKDGTITDSPAYILTM